MHCRDPNPGFGRGRRRRVGRGRGGGGGQGGALPNRLGLPQQAAGLVSSVSTVPGMVAMAPYQQPDQTMTQQASRHARGIYVRGLLHTADEQSVANFFSQAMSDIGGNVAGPGDAVVNVYMNYQKKSAVVEMRSVEEASNAMALDGIILEGVSLEVRRPTGYNPSLAATLGPSQPNPNLNLAAVGLSLGSTGGLEVLERIFVCGLPCHFTEAQVREFLESCGPLSSLDLVKDTTGKSKGYASCVYQGPSGTKTTALAALNGIKIGDKTLTVGREIQGAIEQQAVGTPTKIVCLTQVVTAAALRDDEEYEDLMGDMRQEAGKFGNLVNVVIPRPNHDQDPYRQSLLRLS